MKKVLYVKGDFNDGDYVTNEINTQKFTQKHFDLISRFAKKVYASSGRWSDDSENMEVYELNEDEYEFIKSLIPYSSDGYGTQAHTIDSIRLVEIASDVELVTK